MTELFVVWRRPLLSRAIWQKVPGLAPMGKREAYFATEAQEWIASDVNWEYAVWPVGQQPPQYERGAGSYATKVMKPR